MVVPHNNFVLTYFLYKIHSLQTTIMQQMLFLVRSMQSRTEIVQTIIWQATMLNSYTPFLIIFPFSWQVAKLHGVFIVGDELGNYLFSFAA